ncbi:MAG: MnhB domain-containing protein [Candidatus Methanomethylicaceae archaeon]
MMDPSELRGRRGIIAVIALLIISFGLFSSLEKLTGNVNPGISRIYNILAYLVAPNNIATWVYDWRGFDTLLETAVIYVGAVASALVIGRGVVQMRHYSEESPVSSPPLEYKTESLTVILRFLGLPAGVLLLSYGIMVVTASSTSGGGGFQCGVMMTSAYLLAAIFYGKENPIKFGKRFLVGIGSVGLGGYALLGLPGFLATGFWQYNVGTDVWGIVSPVLHSVFGDPFRLSLTLQEGIFYSTPGIIPLINIAEAFNVIGAIGLIYFAFLYGWSEPIEEDQKGGK